MGVKNRLQSGIAYRAYRAAATAYKVGFGKVMSDTHERPASDARHAAWWVLAEVHVLPKCEIARMVGRDATAVKLGIDQAAWFWDNDEPQSINMEETMRIYVTQMSKQAKASSRK